ncbi:MAG: hypothetical protein ACOX6D_02790 [Thermoguttaceae bacterium]|jgi:hypothetical protein
MVHPAVGVARDGRREVAERAIDPFMLHERLIRTGTRRTGCGAFLWNHNDSIAADETGTGLVESLGIRAAKPALIVPADIFEQGLNRPRQVSFPRGRSLASAT